MLKRLFTTVLAVVGIAGFAQVATAQYMYLDSNANGIHDTGDVLNENGVGTQVDVWIITNQNRDGGTATCNTGDGILQINSYAVNLLAAGGTVTYSGFINQQTNWTVSFGEENDGDGQYKNGRGGPVGNALPPGGPYKLMTIVITGTSGSPTIQINDINTNSADFTSFGTACSGNDFDNTYKLAGPGGGSDWTDVDGLGAPGGEVNTPPVLAPIGNKTVNEGALLSFTATATDADVPAQTLTFSVAGAFGASITPGGAFTWTPGEEFGGNVQGISIQVTDNGNPPMSDSETIQVTVNETNQAPVLAAIGNKTINEGTLLTFTATATDADLPGQSRTFSLGAGAPTGAAITTAGVFSWFPAEAHGPGVHPITVIVSDGSLTDSETIQVTVNEVNAAPVLGAIGDRAGTVGNAVTFTANATDPDLPANIVTFLLGAGAPSGATIGASTGNFSWTPTATGSFPVTVIARDNGTPILQDSESITITIAEEPNSPPVLAAIGNKTVNEGSLLSFTATATDADVPAQTLTFSLGAGNPAGSAITAGGNFTWTPTEAQGFSIHPITITVADNGTGNLTDSETIQVTVNEVNQPPVLGAIGNRTVNEGSLLSFTATATDPDLPSQGRTFSLGAGAPAGAAINAASGAFTWNPSEAQGPGVYPITIIVTDAFGPAPLSDSETIQVTVNDVNSAPNMAFIGNKTVDEGSLLAFVASAFDSDLPAQTLTFSLGAGAPAGAAISAGGSFTWTPGEALGPGVYPITILVTDNGIPSLSDSEAIQVAVNEANTAPALNTIGNKTVNEGNLLSFTATATDADLPAQTLTFTLGAGAPAGAAITAGGNFTWTPTTAQGPGSYPITVIVTDNGNSPLNDSETFTVSVLDGPNTPPVLNAIGNKTVQEQALLAFTATGSSPDPEATLTFVLGAGAPAGAAITTGGSFTWTPTEAQGPGVYPITVILSDGTGTDSETFQVTVQEVNVAPVLAAVGNRTVNEGALLSFTATATDADLPANTLTFSIGAGAPVGAAITVGGNFTWTPTDAQSPGVYPITVFVTDNGTPSLNDSEMIQVTVIEVDTPPVLNAIGNKTVDEGSLLTFTATATDDGGALQFSLAAGAPAGAAITAGGVFTWTPTEAQGPGAYSLTICVSDGSSQDCETIAITVNEVNVAPVLNQPSDMTVNEGASANQQLTATDADVPANALTFSKMSGPFFMTVSTSGLVTVSPGSNDAGSYPAMVRVSDGMANNTKSFTITVLNVNNAPTADANGPYSGSQDVAITFDGTGSSDPDGDALTYSWDFGDGDSGTGATTTHAYSTIGTYTVVLTVTDGTLSDDDTTTATIFDFVSAFVFTTGGNKSIKLNSGKPTGCVQIEPRDGSYDNADVDLTTIRMIFNGNQILAGSGKATVDGDNNRNGITEITACFAKEDLRTLFSGQPNGTYEITLEGDLVGGGFFRGTVSLQVTGGMQFAMAASITPNPLNPKAVLTFATSKPGMVKVQMYDVQGRLIRTLMDESSAAAGYHDVTIDGHDANGSKLASGIYYVKIQSASEGQLTKAVTILK